MLSICIPVYNYDVNELVFQLYEQCNNLNIKFRIFVCEDSSDIEFIKQNEKIAKLENVFHFVNEKNLGRSKTRNLLANLVESGHIIFLDSDSLLPNDKFIENYLKYLNEQVVCGGTVYQKNQLKPNFELRYYYGIKREMISAGFRNEYPNRSFTPNNFMIAKSVFDTVIFNENITEYGHEDTLFGIDLLANSISILHIDNPVIHKGIEENQIFLAKTETALKNLKLIRDNISERDEFIKSVKILSAYSLINKFRLDGLVSFSFNIFKNKIRNYLIKSKHPKVFVLDIYKLGFFCLISNAS